MNIDRKILEEKLIAGNIKDAIDLLKKETVSSDLYDEVIQQSIKFERLQKERRGGIISWENQVLTLNRINHDLIQIKNKIKGKKNRYQ